MSSEEKDACWSFNSSLVLMNGTILTHKKLSICVDFYSTPLTCAHAKMKSSPCLLTAQFKGRLLGIIFPPIFGMTLSGPVGIEALASHHAAGGMINNKH